MALNLKQEQQKDATEKAQRFAARETLPDGTYTLLLASKEMGISKSSNPKIVLDWRVSSGQWAGAEIRDHLTFSMAALFRVNMLLEAIGVPIPDKDFDSVLELREWVYGWLNVMQTRVEAVTQRRQYEDEFKQVRTTVDVQRYQEPPGGNQTEPPRSDVPEPAPEEFKHPKPVADDKVPF
jgi:Protein of unknown function (DUF669)